MIQWEMTVAMLADAEAGQVIAVGEGPGDSAARPSPWTIAPFPFRTAPWQARAAPADTTRRLSSGCQAGPNDPKRTWGLPSQLI